MVVALSVAVPSALAAPSLGSVTFRAEGPSSTLVPLQSVTTQAGSFTHDGNPKHSCPSASAAGVLQTATSGNWDGAFDPKQGDYFVNTIAGVAAGMNQYWSLWYNHKPATSGACGQAVNPGDDVLFFLDCYGSGCPNGGNGYAVLSESVPSVAQAGNPVTIAVTSHDAATGSPTPASGATVTAGSQSVKADTAGRATLTFPAAGSFAVQATAMDSIRSEQLTVCVHAGNDGTCGAPAPSGSPTATTTNASTSSPPLAHLAGIHDGHRYRHGHGPRVVRGTVEGGASLRAVRVRLRRRVGRKCSYYSGRSERFVPIHCGRGFFFTVGSSHVFSYLFPLRLGRGHYALEAEAIATKGPGDIEQVRGRNKSIFDVG